MMERPPLMPSCYYQGIVIASGSLLGWVFLNELCLLVILGIVGFVAFDQYTSYQNKLLPRIDTSGKAVLITGCDSGIGHELAITNNDQGFVVFAGCLDDECVGAKTLLKRSDNRIHVIKMDVTRDEEISSSLDYVTKTCKENGLVLWGLVNNAGITMEGHIELLNMEYYKKVCDVNLYGTVNVTKAFLPLLRQSKGRILNVSSERGIRFPATSSAYCISKAGVESFSDSLRLEMARFGVKVSVIEPGHFGYATGIVTQPVIDATKRNLEKALESASEDVKRSYCHHDIQKIHDGMANVKLDSARNIQPVIVSMSHSLVDPKPRERYMIAGTTGLIDIRIILCRLKPIIPDYITDYFTASL